MTSVARSLHCQAPRSGTGDWTWPLARSTRSQSPWEGRFKKKYYLLIYVELSKPGTQDHYWVTY